MQKERIYQIHFETIDLVYINQHLFCNHLIQQYVALCLLLNQITYIGKDALRKIAEKGPLKLLRGIKFGGVKAPPCGKPFPITTRDGIPLGQITSGIYSPRLECNVGMSMITKGYWEFGTELIVHTPDGIAHEGSVAPLPF